MRKIFKWFGMRHWEIKVEFSVPCWMPFRSWVNIIETHTTRVVEWGFFRIETFSMKVRKCED